MLKFFKVVAILEGISYLALFSNMLSSNPIILIFIKAYCILSDEPRGVVYRLCYCRTLLKKISKLNFKNFAIIQLASPLVLFM
jgi:hypothetical protein